ncbi:MAG: ribosomal-protein-alanine N-acetyltransferase [Rickettsiales bacterium]|nr:ribosomal-protein-alanine N-acetyltransferase [Rickettsiales bacterium]|tara:strand:- start:141 stop:581 length:441 start_codon:yes stop_codon:yes gene_type:complete
MISINEINQTDVDLCFELDSNTVSLWSKKQWESEFKKEGIKVFGISFFKPVIGICVLHVVGDEAHINYFSVNERFQRKGFGTKLMNHLLKECEKLKIKKLLLEVSESNFVAEKFYNHFEFHTVGIRRNYYKDGSNALLKEKKLIKK